MQRCFAILSGLLGSNPAFPSSTHTAPLFPANPFPYLSCSQKNTQAYTGMSGLWWGEGGLSQLMPVLVSHTQVLPDVRAVPPISYFEYHPYPQSPSPLPIPLQVSATIPQTSRLTLQGLAQSCPQNDFPS